MRTPVHPHGRGEHSLISRGPGCSNGSSPRAWGTLGLLVQGAAVARFIPTGVGNTRLPRNVASFWSVHPHGRGEHIDLEDHATVTRGSSPRAWGTRANFAGLAVRRRFIPTGVGNTAHMYARRTV